MTELEPEARALVNEIIDTFVDGGECDFHDDFATPLPSTIFLALMGLPQSGPAATSCAGATTRSVRRPTSTATRSRSGRPRARRSRTTSSA